mgnify:CR=1 FL=1
MNQEGPHQLDHGGGGVVGTYFGPRDVHGGVKGLLHHVGSKKRGLHTSDK